LFEGNPVPKKPKKFITAAFPYPNSPQHIGHGRAYTTTDIHARYWRMQGYNVLFPMAFHVTGTPILAMAKRIAKGDKEIYDIFERIYGIPPSTTRTLAEPTKLVMHFSEEIEQGMQEMGYAIDWRRKFYSFDKPFNRFIQWQFRKLKEKKHLVQGAHPIAWCPSDNQAVGAHDTQGDVDPELKEFTAIKFRYRDGYLLTATLRPETVYGVTNIWVNPEVTHVKAKSKNGGIYYVSKKAAEKMNAQDWELEVLEELKGEALLKGKAKNLVTREEVPLYKAPYVKEEEGTGIVMSVPSHAPYDYIALRDMGKPLEFPPIVKVEGYTFMAKELIEQRNIRDQHDPKLEQIVKEVYKKEILAGVMVAGPYKGERVSTAIEKTKADMLKNKQAIVLWDIGNKPVRCRCGAEAIATILKDQWFIDYGNAKWKEKTKECLAQMAVIPEKTRSEYEYAIDWFKQKACARKQGLGTKFPFDEQLVIEALSDSTIYMAFYTFAHLLKDFDEKEMDEDFFDYVLLGKGKGKAKWKKFRESFLYWYPLDSRHSGADLIRNHLPFFIFNHVALFEEKLWPKQIVTNGFVLMEGKKMSKSLANILPLRKAIQEYGADVVRFAIVSGAELSQDADFSPAVAEGTRMRLQFISNLVKEETKHRMQDPKTIEAWLLSRLHRKLAKAGELYEKFALRELALALFYEMYTDLRWAIKRDPEVSLHRFFKAWTPAMAPFIPHHAEEFWAMLGEKPFVSNAPFLKADEQLINGEVEQAEELVQTIFHDSEKIAALLGKKPTAIYIYVASPWKFSLYKLTGMEKDMKTILEKAAQHPILRHYMKDASRLVKAWSRNFHALPPVLREDQELEALQTAQTFLAKELGCKVQIAREKDGKHEKAKNALPGKPAIVLE